MQEFAPGEELKLDFFKKKRKSKPLHDSAPTASACDLLCEMHQKGDNPRFCGGRELRKGWEQQRGLAEGPGAEKGSEQSGMARKLSLGGQGGTGGTPHLGWGCFSRAVGRDLFPEQVLYAGHCRIVSPGAISDAFPKGAAG